MTEYKRKELIQRTPVGLIAQPIPIDIYSLFEYFLPPKYKQEREYVIV
jgi:hypothetical protein